MPPWPWFNIKMSSYQYRKSHCGDKTVARLSYFHNGISYTGKITSLYWSRAQGLRSDLLCVLPHTRRRQLWHLAARLNLWTEARSLFTMLQTDNLLRIHWIISARRRGAEIFRLSLTIRINCLSSRDVVRLPRPPRLRWCGRLVSRLSCKSYWRIRTTHSTFLPLLSISLSRQSYNLYQLSIWWRRSDICMHVK